MEIEKLSCSGYIVKIEHTRLSESGKERRVKGDSKVFVLHSCKNGVAVIGDGGSHRVAGGLWGERG